MTRTLKFHKEEMKLMSLNLVGSNSSQLFNDMQINQWTGCKLISAKAFCQLLHRDITRANFGRKSTLFASTCQLKSQQSCARFDEKSANWWQILKNP